MIEPFVSVPTVAAARLAAAAAADPELEPQACRSNTCGFLTKPPTEDHPETEWEDRKFAH